MLVKLVIFPTDDGLNVLIWGRSSQGTMRVQHFETRTAMIASLQALNLITPDDAVRIDEMTFTDVCPLFSGDVDEETLEKHGFSLADV